jgi:hypothetical protein
VLEGEASTIVKIIMATRRTRSLALVFDMAEDFGLQVDMKM